MALKDNPVPVHSICLQLYEQVIRAAYAQERERIRNAFLRAWSKDRGDSPQHPHNYHKETWMKAQAAIETPEIFETPAECARSNYVAEDAIGIVVEQKEKQFVLIWPSTNGCIEISRWTGDLILQQIAMRYGRFPSHDRDTLQNYVLNAQVGGVISYASNYNFVIFREK